MKKHIMNVSFTAAVAALSFPLLVFAQFERTSRIIGNGATIVRMLVITVASLAVLMFFWGLVKYIASAGNVEEAKKGKSIMTYGIIALFVMFSILGIIQFIGSELTVPTETDMFFF
jgi:hypothetical protein